VLSPEVSCVRVSRRGVGGVSRRYSVEALSIDTSVNGVVVCRPVSRVDPCQSETLCTGAGRRRQPRRRARAARPDPLAAPTPAPDTCDHKIE